jgi:hypothetical protein
VQAKAAADAMHDEPEAPTEGEGEDKPRRKHR